MIERTMTVVVLTLVACCASLALPSSAQSPDIEFDYRERTRELAFDPNRFFPERIRDLHISVVYMGDDYNYPVYAFGVRLGCVSADKGEARKSCWNNRVARMVRSPWPADADKPERPRWRGTRLFDELSRRAVQDDLSLAKALSDVGTQWLEADLATCPTALAKLETFREIDFIRFAPFLPKEHSIPVILHADTIAFEYGNRLQRSRYFGARIEGSPSHWADEFVQSFEGCWKPSAAPAPWLISAD